MQSGPVGPVPNPSNMVPTSALSATERSIVSAVDPKSADGLALLERIVNINSGTMNFAGVRQVGDILRKELDALGFATRWAEEAAFGRAGHLIAERTGTGPRLLLIGHLDTVFEPSSHFQKLEKLSDSTARGPGVIDMKGGDVIMLQSFKALKAAGVLDRMSITAVFSGDEEAAGRPLELARAELIAAAKRSQYAIGFEDGSGDPRTAVISRRGATSWTLRSTGVPAHSSQIFRSDIGAGAIFESARVLEQFRLRLSGEQYLTFNPGYAIGGTDVRTDSTQPGGTAYGKSNVVSKNMEVSGDIRALSPRTAGQRKDSDALDLIGFASSYELGAHVRRRISTACSNRWKPAAPFDVRSGEPRPRLLACRCGGSDEGGSGRRIVCGPLYPDGTRCRRACRMG